MWLMLVEASDKRNSEEETSDYELSNSFNASAFQLLSFERPYY